MCIAFFWINDEGDVDANDYKLILVMNRDEFKVRKTEEANWGPNGVLCGRDMEPGKEGGTWLGVDGKGRVGLLTNIFTGGRGALGGENSTGKGRGFLVVDFLADGATDASQYLETLSGSGSAYNPFNLILLEPNEEAGRYVAHYYRPESKFVESQPPVCLSSTKFNVFGISNSPYDKPYNKVTTNVEAFRSEVEAFRNVGNGDEEVLINRLFEVMTSRERGDVDPQMLRQMDPEDPLPEGHLRSLTSTFVDVGTAYGTRTQTVVLVDGGNGVTFAERTRVNAGEDQPLEFTEIKKFKFKIDEK